MYSELMYSEMQNQDLCFETTRLRIVPFSEAYLTPQYVGWLNDPHVVRFSEQRHRPHTMETCHAYWRSFARTPNHLWAIVARQSEPGNKIGHIGNISVAVDPVNSVADIGIMLGEKGMWNQGYGLEAWSAVCSHLLCGQSLRKITAGTLSVNTAMLGIMRRAGMIEDGRRVNQILFEGQEVDVIHMALFRDKQRESNNI